MSILHSILKAIFPPPGEWPRIEVVNVQPGDVIVFRYPTRLNADQAEILCGHLKKQFPDNEVVIIDNGASLEVMRHSKP